MGFILLKKICFFFLIISASFVSTSFAGGRSSFISKLKEENGATINQEEFHQVVYDEEIPERVLLRANTKDYGRYDPAPALVKPPFKLIPN